jgi:hypothetical protein
MQFKHQEMKNNGYNGCIKWKTFVQKSEKKELVKWENIFTQELYMQENLPLFLQDLTNLHLTRSFGLHET